MDGLLFHNYRPSRCVLITPLIVTEIKTIHFDLGKKLKSTRVET